MFELNLVSQGCEVVLAAAAVDRHKYTMRVHHIMVPRVCSAIYLVGSLCSGAVRRMGRSPA